MTRNSISTAILCFALFACQSLFAQRRPLEPNNTPQVIRTTIQPVSNIDLRWIDGRIDIQFGASTNEVEIRTFSNLASLYAIEQQEGRLEIEITGNNNNRLWLEDDKTQVIIRTTAQPDNIGYACNADATVTGIGTGALKIVKSMNGNLDLSGKVSTLVLRQEGNGSTRASNLSVNRADVVISGNGDAQMNTNLFTQRAASGNGQISNTTDTTTVSTSMPAQPRINVTLFNNSARYVEVFVTGTNENGKTFSYGISLFPLSKQTEALPAGTKIKLENRFGKTLSTIEPALAGKTIRLFAE